MTTLLVRQFDAPQNYETIWRSMQTFTANRTVHAFDEVWLLEHESVYTQGQAGKSEHLLNPGKIPVVQSDRGGQITWHGLGQLMFYTLLDHHRHNLGARDLVNLLEKILITTLRDLGVAAYASSSAPGVYVKKDTQDAKIAALGLRIKKNGCYHGAALNIDCDLAPFSGIHPCGYADQPVTRLSDCLPQLPARAEIEHQLICRLAQELGYSTIQRTSGYD